MKYEILSIFAFGSLAGKLLKLDNWQIEILNIVGELLAYVLVYAL